MLQLLKDYAVDNGMVEDHSILLLVREVQKADATPRPLNMAIMGETPEVASHTLYYAARIIQADRVEEQKAQQQAAERGKANAESA